MPSPSSATSPPQPPTCAATVLVRSGESAAFGLVISEADNVGISSGLVTKRARCAPLPGMPESQVSTAARPT